MAKTTNVALSAYKSGVNAASRGKTKHRRGKTTIPLAVVAGFVPLGATAIGLVQSNGIQGLAALPSYLIPYDFVNHRFTMENTYKGLGPILGGIAVHKFIGGKLGVNRALASARIPWLRL